MIKKKFGITVNSDDKGNISVNQNIQTIFIYSLCLMFALGLNNLLDIFLKGKKYSILFYIIYITIIVAIIIILSYRIKSSISL
jgi:hypothetical protein